MARRAKRERRVVIPRRGWKYAPRPSRTEIEVESLQHGRLAAQATQKKCGAGARPEQTMLTFLEGKPTLLLCGAKAAIPVSSPGAAAKVARAYTSCVKGNTPPKSCVTSLPAFSGLRRRRRRRRRV